MAKAKIKETKKAEKKAASIEDKLLGNTIEEKPLKIKNYEDPSVKYKVTNLTVNNKPIIINGSIVETFIGSKNIEARRELRSGAKMVITKDPFSGKKLYKIEVLK